MSSNTKRAIAYGSAVAVTIAALVAVFIDNRREATFFPDGRDRRWPVTPVVVSYSAGVGQAWGPQVRDAVKAINDEVDCTVLDTSGAPANIRILTPVDDSPCANQGTEIVGDTGAITHVCDRGTTDIVVWQLVHTRQAYLALKHELLHALGLDHDNGGLMAPVLRQQDWDGPLDVPGSLISQRDRNALRDRYCR